MFRRVFGRVVIAACLLVGGVAGAATVSTVASTVTASPAEALCARPPEAGNWRNIDANTDNITRVEVRMGCNDVVLCPLDEPGECTGGQVTFDMRAWGACSPTDCDWGRRTAGWRAGGDGDWLVASWDFGFVVQTVWVRTYTFEGSEFLRVWAYNDFTPADGRRDFSSDEWFVRA